MWTEVGKRVYVAYQATGTGPRSRMLSIGRIISNNVYAQTVLLQPHRAVWGKVKLSYHPLYMGMREEGGKWTTEAGERPAVESVVPYQALVMQEELLAGSELRHGAATQLE